MYNRPGFKQLIERLNFVLVHIEHFLASLGLGPNWTWGLAIIGLTIIVRLILFPLTWKQFSSAQAMQAVQPKLKELQKKHKGARKPPPGKGKKKAPPPASGTQTNKHEPADG